MDGPPPLRFTADDMTVELAAHDLPEPPIQWGGAHRKTVTRYSRDWVSVQSHGIDLEPVEVKGELKDQRWGIKGHAQQARKDLEAMMHARQIVRLEYDSDTLFGTFEVTFEEVRRDFVRYTIRFDPYWRDDPQFQKLAAPKPEVQTARATLADRVQDTLNHGLAPPSSIINTAWLSQTRRELLALQNDVNAVLGELQGVQNFAELAIDNVNLVKRGLSGAINAVQSGLNRNKGIAIASLSIAGAPLAASADFVWTLSRKQRLTRADLVRMYRRLLAQSRPVSRRRYLVRDGDTIQRIAQRELGSFDRWTEIADANDLETGDVAVGQLLVIPRR